MHMQRLRSTRAATEGHYLQKSHVSPGFKLSMHTCTYSERPPQMQEATYLPIPAAQPGKTTPLSMPQGARILYRRPATAEAACASVAQSPKGKMVCTHSRPPCVGLSAPPTLWAGTACARATHHVVRHGRAWVSRVGPMCLTLPTCIAARRGEAWRVDAGSSRPSPSPTPSSQLPSTPHPAIPPSKPPSPYHRIALAA